MLGPNPAVGDAPAFFDSDGSGGPSPCDQQIVPLYDPVSDAITIHTPYENCDGSNNFDNTFHLLRDINHVPTEIYRDREPSESEVLTPTDFFLPNQPFGGHLDIFKMGGLIQSGDGHLVPGGPGFFNGVQGGQTFGGITTATMSLVFTGTGSGGSPAYVSLPWSQVAALGILATSCPTPVPQVFVPLSNGHIVLDLNGDGIPDPIFFSSPPLTKQAGEGSGIPTISRGAMALLAAALVGVGLFQLRRGGLGF
jgi:hypothetical protein